MKVSLRKAHSLIENLDSKLKHHVPETHFQCTWNPTNPVPIMEDVVADHYLQLQKQFEREFSVIDTVSSVRRSIKKANSTVVLQTGIEGVSTIDDLIALKLVVESKMRLLARYGTPTEVLPTSNWIDASELSQTLDASYNRAKGEYTRSRVGTAAQNTEINKSIGQLSVSTYAIDKSHYETMSNMYYANKSLQTSIVEALAYANNTVNITLTDGETAVLNLYRLL